MDGRARTNALQSLQAVVGKRRVERIFEELAKPQDGDGDVLMIDATHLKAHRTASSLKKGGDELRLTGPAKGGLNTKLHALCDNHGRPVRLHLTEGQRSDFKGAVYFRTCRKPKP